MDEPLLSALEWIDLLPPFRQHAIHDVEPFYWTAVWFLYKLTPDITKLPTGYYSAYDKLFVSGNRLGLWQRPAALREVVDSGLPILFENISTTLASWQLCLLVLQRGIYSAVPTRNPSEVAKWSPQVIQLSIKFVQELRECINKERQLQGELMFIM